MTPARQDDHELVTLKSLLEEPLLRTSTVFADDDALERPVSWCLPWSVTSRGTETVQHMLVHVDEDLSPAVLEALCREVPTLNARGVSALAVNASEPGELLRKAACAARLPLLGLPEHTAHVALSRLVAEKNLANAAHVLRYGVTVHHALGEVLYRGAGLAAMANQIRRLSGCSVLMLDTHLEFLETDLIGVEPLLAEEVAASVRGRITSGELMIDPQRGKSTAVTVSTSARELTVVAAAIVLGGTNYGWLLLLERAHPPHRHDLAQHLVLAGEAATITGSEMLRQRSVEAAVERARGDFVHALLHARFSNPHEVASRAGFHGFDVGAVYGVIALSGAFDTSTPAGLERQGSLLLAVRRMRPASGQPVLATAVGDLLVVVAQLGPGPSRDVTTVQAMLAAFGRDLFSEVSKRVRREVQAAFGRPAIGAAGVAASYREARVALGIAQRLGLREPCGYAELRSYAALADLTHSQHALTFAHDMLEPLRSSDSAGEGLLTVVLTYIGSGGNVNAAARRLHLHRNTLFNKLDRASRLLQLDVREPEAMFRIWLAYRIDLLASVDADVSGELGLARASRPTDETTGPTAEAPTAPAELSANGRHIELGAAIPA